MGDNAKGNGMYKQTEIEIRGVAPLLMHNGQLANPMNPWVRLMKNITSKPSKQRTDDDLIELARLEFMGGLYLDEKGEPCIPGENLEALLIQAARGRRQGKQAESGIICDGNFPLIYDGPRNADKLWADERFRFTKSARPSGQGRVMRTRPIFRAWSLAFTLSYDPSFVDDAKVKTIVELAQSVGLGDWKPRFGRFEVQA